MSTNARTEDNIAGDTSMSYLYIAAEAAERGDWESVERNAKEAAIYADVAKKVKRLNQITGKTE